MSSSTLSTTEISSQTHENVKKRKLSHIQTTLPFAKLPLEQIKVENPPKSPKKLLILKKLQDKWLQNFSWLVFDKELDKMFCNACLILKNKDSKVDNNMTRGTNNFQKSTLKEHLKLDSHTKALKLEDNSLSSSKQDNQNPITNLFRTNKEKLQFLEILPLFKGVYWIAKENLPLLKFDSLNVLLSTLNVEFNPNYRNRKSGYEIVQHISETIREKIVKSLQNCLYFGITIDSSSDISNHENLAVSIRFLDENNKIRDIFMKLIELEKKDANTVYNKLKKFLNETGLFYKLVGIATDGEKTISSKKNGVIGKFLNQAPYLVSIHCICHRLSLGTKDVCKLPEFSYLVGLNKLYINYVHIFQVPVKELRF